MKALNQVLAASVLGLCSVTAAQAVPLAADVIFVVDESGSMAGEHAWLGSMVSDLEAGLLAAGVGTGTDTNNYALVGYGASASGHGSFQGAHDDSSGWTSAAGLSTATSGLVASGGREDGWQAIDFALSNYATRTGNYALNVILITDEDRDINYQNGGASLTYASTLASLSSAGGVLNSVVNCGFSAANQSAIGVDSNANGYVADGSGGFTKEGGGMQSGYCFGTTKTDYVDMAWATGGAAWDLNQLRAGGLTATSFTKAFVDVKVKEIIIKTPEPGSLALIGLGLLGMGFAKKRSARKMAA